MSEAESDRSKAISLTAEVVAAFVSNNSLPVVDLPTLIQSTHDALTRVQMRTAAPAEPEAKPPAVPIRKSITTEYLICLDDGLKFKSLKRHIGTLGMTPDQYREKWGLPKDYPMAAPDYAATRSALAKRIGLGQQRRKIAPAPIVEEPVKGRRRRSAKTGP
jgi:predicted transcriptional regulator